MSTRSMIATLNQDSSVKAIYCHFDGYVEGVGITLLSHWNTLEKVQSLMELGDLSSLGSEIGQKQDFNLPTDKTWCLAYGRDRGETDVGSRDFHSLHYAEGNYGDVDYLYVFDGTHWSFKRRGAKEYADLGQYAITELTEKVS